MREPHSHSPHKRRSESLALPFSRALSSLSSSGIFPSVNTLTTRAVSNTTMSVPEPEVALEGHCSVIFDNTLYTYQPEALQAIQLDEGAEWTRLSTGVPVSGAVCTLAVPEGDVSRAALYVVGGRSNDEGSDYPGLQRYVFADQEWETITPVVTVTQDRVNHAATYLEQSNSIFVYAGLQADGRSGPSSQTFVISTEPPFEVQAFTSRAPPVVSPILLSWSEAQAVMLGGDPDNRKLFTFAPETAWEELNVRLPSGFQDPDTVSATLVRAEDGSRILEIFDMGASPNEVTQILIGAPDGQDAELGQVLNQPEERKRKRDLTLADWPAYDDTFAPTTSRSGFSLASGANGLVVISGGGEESPLAIFDQRENAWVNETQLFLGSEVNLSSISSPSSSTSPESTSTDASASSAPSASDAESSRDEMLTILGITLGGVFGAAILLAAVLIFIRWRREKMKRAAAKAAHEKDDRLSFADRGGPMLGQGDLPPIDPYNKPPVLSYNPFASPPQPLIPPTTTVDPPQDAHHRRGGGELGSDANSTTGLLYGPAPMGDADRSGEQTRGFGDRPYAVLPDKMVPRTEPTPPSAVLDPSPYLTPGQQTQSNQQQQTPSDRGRSSGWSKYFNNPDAANNMAAAPAERGTYASSQSRSSTTSQNGFSDPQRAAAAANAEHDPPKLDTHHVAMGNPTVGTGQTVRAPQRAEVMAHHDSLSSSSTDQDGYYENRGSYGFNPPDLRKKSFLDETSTNEDGRSMLTKKSGDTDSAPGNARPTSSIYGPISAAGIPPYPPEPHPGVPSSIYPRQPASSVYPKSMGYNSFYDPNALAAGVMFDSNEPLPTNNPNVNAEVRPSNPYEATADAKKSNVEAGTGRRRTSNDMSWLNLGANPQ